MDAQPYNPWAAPVYPGQNDNAMQPETYVNPLANHFFNGMVDSVRNMMMTPGQVMQPNPYPTGSEEASWYNDQRGRAVQQWAPETAMNVMGGAGVVPAEANSLRMGIKAYHGSPHDFDAFDLSKIGTGEGAQAYGHGLYFADNEGVAKSYKTAGPASDAQYNEINSKLSSIARQRDELKSTDYYPGAADWEAKKAKYIDLGAQYDALMEQRTKVGKMYEVNINADPAHFLDWDKPLSGNAKDAVHSALKQQGIGDTVASYLVNNKTGAEIYNALSRGEYRPNLMASEAGAVPASTALRDAGIPGIKYLDQGSRGAGEGSSNYVVFNDKLIDILRKYAIPGMLGAPIFANAVGEQKP